LEPVRGVDTARKVIQPSLTVLADTARQAKIHSFFLPDGRDNRKLSDRIGRPHAGSRHGGYPVSSRMVRQ
ncbi:MAG: hypothetical protein WB803_25565, partial [Pseudolabrys sp.]